jgi:D-glycero-alpha-D-manno-heptose 1-phosphate guanylyltransferase
MSGAPANACAVILAGGAGTRIRHLYPDLPKPFIPVAGRPLLEWICEYWIRQGVRRLVISLGHMAEVAEREIAGWNWPGVEIMTVREEAPLGTGGAVRFAAAAARDADPLVVLNGDSLLVADMSGAWSLLEDAGTGGVVIGVEMEDASRFGSLRIGPEGILAGFEEKRPGRAWINAGIYLFRRRLLSLFPPREPLSMEHDVFPALLASGVRLRVLRTTGSFIDIGSPDSLAEADAFVMRHAQELAG